MPTSRICTLLVVYHHRHATSQLVFLRILIHLIYIIVMLVCRVLGGYLQCMVIDECQPYAFFVFLRVAICFFKAVPLAAICFDSQQLCLLCTTVDQAAQQGGLTCGIVFIQGPFFTCTEAHVAQTAFHFIRGNKCLRIC